MKARDQCNHADVVVSDGRRTCIGKADGQRSRQEYEVVKLFCVNSRDEGSRVETTALKRARGTMDNEAKVKSGRSMLKGEHASNY